MINVWDGPCERRGLIGSSCGVVHLDCSLPDGDDQLPSWCSTDGRSRPKTSNTRVQSILKDTLDLSDKKRCVFLQIRKVTTSSSEAFSSGDLWKGFVMSHTPKNMRQIWMIFRSIELSLWKALDICVQSSGWLSGHCLKWLRCSKWLLWWLQCKYNFVKSIIFKSF